MRDPDRLARRVHHARVVGYSFDVSTREAVARNAERTGRAQVAGVAIFTAAKRLEQPELAEGFDQLFRVRPGAERRFTVHEMTTEGTMAIAEQTQDVKSVERDELKAKIDRKETLVVEALAPEQFREGHLPGALNIPSARVKELAPRLLPDKEKEVVVYCAEPGVSRIDRCRASADRSRLGVW